jgi:hypothetical protein
MIMITYVKDKEGLQYLTTEIALKVDLEEGYWPPNGHSVRQ